MTALPRKRHLNPKARRALQLVASNALGVSEDLILDHGFTRTMVDRLVRAGLAEVQREVVDTGRKGTEFERIVVTTAGRRALES